MAKKKIKPDQELEDTKIKLLRQENKLGFLQNMIRANERRVEVLKAENGIIIESLEDTLISQRKHEAEYLARIDKLNAYTDKMLNLQQPKKKAKPKKTVKKTKKKKTKAEKLAEKQAEFEAEMARLKAEEPEIEPEPEIIPEPEPEPEGEEPSQMETIT